MFTIGNLVKLNPEIFPEGMKEYDLLDTLGYPGLFRYLVFEVEKTETDSNRGEIVHCRVTNLEVLKDSIPRVKEVKCEGSLILFMKDLVNP